MLKRKLGETNLREQVFQHQSATYHKFYGRFDLTYLGPCHTTIIEFLSQIESIAFISYQLFPE